MTVLCKNIHLHKFSPFLHLLSIKHFCFKNNFGWLVVLGLTAL